MRLALLLLLSACGDGALAPDDLAALDLGGADSGSSACGLTADTSPTGVVTSGCALLARDVSGCDAARAAAGLSGFWRKFSCQVSLTVSSTAVTVHSIDFPDYLSSYFPTSDACYTPRTSGTQNPNQIVQQSITLTVPLAPTTTGQAQPGGTIGLAVNGVAIFNNQAAPGDDIFKEASTFDACQGHPTPNSVYHYHSEPYAISYDDDHLIGVLRDGYPLYGRRDSDGSLPTLDASGGHTSITPDSATPVYHYHVNQQTSTASGTAGQMQWFLTTGTYHGTPGTCSGC